MMTDSQKLLADYVRDGSEMAFRELVARYIDLVYSAAVRLADNDTHLAEDITQTVFIDLARMARTLSRDVMLGGWLHRHTCFVASKALRSERRRQNRERQAVEMSTQEDHTAANLAEVGPILDEAINGLSAEDRTAILLRFFEQRDLRSVGDTLGSSENAAQKRVTRALEQLRLSLQRRGVAFSTAAAVGTVLTTGVVSAAPAGLASTVAATALTSAAAGTATALTTLKLMAATKVKSLALASLVGAAIIIPLVIRQQRLANENQSLRQQTARLAQLTAENERLARQLAATASIRPRLPVPAMPAAVPAAQSTEELPTGTLYSRLQDNTPKLTPEQIEKYLTENQGSAASMLASFRTTRNFDFLQEAMRRFPDEPLVAFEAVLQGDLSPEERRRWVDTFKKTDPDNALPNYLSALDHLKSGHADQAVQELISASDKQRFEDYSLNRVQDDEEVYLSAGYPVAEAKTISSMQLLLPQLHLMKELSANLLTMAGSYQQAGDAASAQAVLQMSANLGRRYSNPSPGEAEISRLVGMVVERMACSRMDPNSPYGNTGQTVGERLNQLASQESALKQMSRQLEPLFPKVSDQDWISYKDRWRVFGEESAGRWLLNKYGQK